MMWGVSPAGVKAAYLKMPFLLSRAVVWREDNLWQTRQNK
jgi:hypothetical protein